MTEKVKLKRLRSEAKIPTRATEGSVGYDLYSASRYTLFCGDSREISTGIALEIPFGWEGQIRPRSSIAKRGIVLINSPGTIDSDYRGEVKLLMAVANWCLDESVAIDQGERIAQLVFSRIQMPELIEVEELGTTLRGEGGFGSTGR